MYSHLSDSLHFLLTRSHCMNLLICSYHYPCSDLAGCKCGRNMASWRSTSFVTGIWRCILEEVPAWCNFHLNSLFQFIDEVVKIYVCHQMQTFTFCVVEHVVQLPELSYTWTHNILFSSWSDNKAEGARGGFGLTAEPHVTVETLTPGIISSIILWNLVVIFCSYCGHFQIRKQFWLLNQIGNSLNLLAIDIHENCQFKLQNASEMHKL